MSDLPQEQKAPQAKAKSSRTIFLVVLGILVTVLTIKVLVDQKEKTNTKDFYEVELNNSKEKLDKISKELELKIHTIDSLGGDITELQTTLIEIEKERAQLKSNRVANRQTISKLKQKTDGYEELLKEKDIEITRLNKIAKQLMTENKDLKVEKNQLNESIVSLNEDRIELEGKVAVASQLKVEGIHIYAVSKSGKERENEFKNRQLNSLKIVFNIAKNDVAPLLAKEIFIRIIDENNQAVFDVNKGSGSFMLNGKETFYTASKDVLFDNSNQMLSYTYDRGSEYEPGVYKMEVFTDGYLMGAKTFTVK